MSRKVIVNLLTRMGVKDAGTLNAERAVKKLSRRLEEAVPSDLTKEEMDAIIAVGIKLPGTKGEAPKSETPILSGAAAVAALKKAPKAETPKGKPTPAVKKSETKDADDKPKGKPGRKRDGESGLSVMRELLVSGKKVAYPDLKAALGKANVSERTFGHYLSRTSREEQLLGFLTERVVERDAETKKIVAKFVQRAGGEETSTDTKAAAKTKKGKGK